MVVYVLWEHTAWVRFPALRQKIYIKISNPGFPACRQAGIPSTPTDIITFFDLLTSIRYYAMLFLVLKYKFIPVIYPSCTMNGKNMEQLKRQPHLINRLSRKHNRTGGAAAPKASQKLAGGEQMNWSQPAKQSTGSPDSEQLDRGRFEVNQ